MLLYWRRSRNFANYLLIYLGYSGTLNAGCRLREELSPNRGRHLLDFCSPLPHLCFIKHIECSPWLGENSCWTLFKSLPATSLTSAFLSASRSSPNSRPPFLSFKMVFLTEFVFILATEITQYPGYVVPLAIFSYCSCFLASQKRSCFLSFSMAAL